MQELDGPDFGGSRGEPDIHVRQVAWIGYGDGPKHLYKRHRLIDQWVRASGDNRETEFATFQDLRRKGYVLVNKEGGPILDENGHPVGDKPLPPAKSTISMEAVQAGLEMIKTVDMDSVPEGDNPITRLLTLEDRISLIRFNDALVELPREILIGHALQVALKVQGHGGAVKLTDGVITPPWMQSCMEIGDAGLIGHLVLTLAQSDKDAILALLKKLLPEVVRLERLKTNTEDTNDRGTTLPNALPDDWRDEA